MILLISLLFCIPSLLFITVLVLGLSAKRKEKIDIINHKPCAILIPAHNETEVIEATLKHLIGIIGKNDEIFVVADNCTDDTAKKARNTGVNVFERFDDQNRGKGFALDFGSKLITSNYDFETVVVFDADCLFKPDSYSKLVSKSQTANSVVQSQYLMLSPNDERIDLKISEFTWAVKNDLRARGMKTLGLGCHIQGSGFAFPTSMLRDISLASSSIVEDLELGLNLALKGQPAIYFDEAKVFSYFPENKEGAASQRKRWEHGHLGMIKMFPKYAYKAIKNFDLKTFALLVDAAIPPTILWILILSTLSMFALLLNIYIENSFLIFIPACFLITTVLLIFTWFTYGKSITSSIKFNDVVDFLSSKLTVYNSFFKKPETEWVKTKRDVKNELSHGEKNDKS
ncbi:Family 2 glycosyl transferase [Alteromonas alvinellae]